MNPERTLLQQFAALAGPKIAKLTEDELARHFIADLVKSTAPLLSQHAMGHRKTTEDGLTNEVHAHLSTTYPIHREPDSVGHVDIALKHPVSAVYCVKVEAKVLDDAGFDWYRQGLTKLVAKYNRGREKLAVMLLYSRHNDTHALMSRHRATLKARRPASYRSEKQLSALGLAGERFVFATRHRHKGHDLVVVHIWIDMYAPTDNELLDGGSRKPAKRISAGKAPSKTSSKGSERLPGRCSYQI